MESSTSSPLSRSSSPLRIVHDHPPPPKHHSQSHSHSPISSPDELKAPPINWFLLMPVLLIRVADAMSYAVIFPFITEMITSFDVPRERIGLYSGLGEGSLMLTEACLATTWAKIADKYGRRPAMLWGFFGVVLAAPMVGFSKSVWAVIFWRGLFGAGPSGIVPKILISEMAHPLNRSKIFSVSSPSFYVGLLLGTFIGGELANPYGRLPGWLGGQTEFWKKWPYALPCLVTGAMGVIALIVGALCLPETRPIALDHNDDVGGEKRASKGKVGDCLRVPGFVLITTVFCLFQITTMCFDGIFTVMTYTPADRGGLELPVDNIGILFSIGSLMYIILTPILLPRLEKRLGAVQALIYVFSIWLVITLLIPVLQWAAGRARGLMWVLLLTQLLMKVFGNFAWPMLDVLCIVVFDDCPELLAMGSAISLIAGAFGRAAGPAISGWLYSISTTYPAGTLGRQCAWLAMLAFCIPPLILIRFVPGDGYSKRPDKEAIGYESLPMIEEGRLSEWEERDEHRGRDSSEVRMASGRELHESGVELEDRAEGGHHFAHQ
ncbi:major facilitator superfamily domain-containing protein [Naematelia encephala]|uniref:Major facilitator superfamily domain-containing protein n=1 Tax=Naematelia encephala TaxID=71784 RepID=A0A1Y2BFC9_9TREE|nr:major facilitator superfamily domain-containing protein [Naematelia encephala]